MLRKSYKPQKRRRYKKKAAYYIFSIYLPKDKFKKLNLIGQKKKITNGEVIRRYLDSVRL